jgi:hypothetical protein
MTGPNDKGVGDCGANPPKTHQNERPHFADTGDDRKALATMKARAALCGCTLIEMADGEFLVARCNYSRAVPCLRAVGDLLRQIGGR